MSNPYPVSPRAELDLAEQWLYIARDDLAAADRLIDSFHETFRRLAQFPLMGEARPAFGKQVRVAPHRNRIIFYQPEGEGVFILRVIHGARDFRSLDQE